MKPRTKIEISYKFLFVLGIFLLVVSGLFMGIFLGDKFCYLDEGLYQPAFSIWYVIVGLVLLFVGEILLLYRNDKIESKKVEEKCLA